VKRLLIYSQDGMGLGHLRRSSNIASEVLARDPACDVLIIADSPAVSLISPRRGIDFLKLPTIVKTGSRSWRNGSFSTEMSRILSLRANVILEAIRSFRPDTVLVDHMPVGALGELKPMLEMVTEQRHPPRLFLGLRDILDEPAVIRRVWSELGAYEYLAKYDAVLIYGRREIHDSGTAYCLRSYAQRIVYSSYVGPSLTANRAFHPKADQSFILVMGGGGNDAFPLAKTFLEAFPEIGKELRTRAVVLTGPNMSSKQRDLLLRSCRSSSVRIENGIEDATPWIRDASAILTMAGYNSLCEILKWRKRALVVPRAGPSAEQQIRSRLFAERSLVRALGPGTPAPEQLAEALLRLVLEGGVPNEVAIPPLNGAARSASLLLRWPSGVRELAAENGAAHDGLATVTAAARDDAGPNEFPAEQALPVFLRNAGRAGANGRRVCRSQSPAELEPPTVAAEDGASVA
jgi:predicted glycosyltransferase